MKFPLLPLNVIFTLLHSLSLQSLKVLRFAKAAPKALAAVTKIRRQIAANEYVKVRAWISKKKHISVQACTQVHVSVYACKHVSMHACERVST